MSYLETKRNAIMNAIASGEIPNLFEGVTWTDGYLASNGTVVVTTQNGAKVTDFIPIDNTRLYVIVAKTSGGTGWCAICSYDTTQQTSYGRTVTENVNDYTQGMGLRSTAEYIRFSLRTFNNECLVGLYDVTDLFNDSLIDIIGE